ncbi:MAG: TIGR04282 family arsenosugar biosynthesis glycosyltransferase [Elusimicrobia bacterium]|nr:TIGR04282 family arsenosugar biosynthesis glycosyltransferase [Elusimicrobiota bacterium]
MSPFRRALVVFLKAPVPGLVKTRLTPVLSPDEAAGFYRALARDTLDVVRDWAELSDGHFPRVAYQSHARFPDLRWTGFAGSFFEQEGTTLGDRLDHAFRRVFEEGHQQAVALGTDAPEISVDRLTEAFRSLDRHDAVLGPARDGGYYLLGLRRPCPALFAEMPWSSDRVLAETIRRLDAARLSHERLDVLDDIDDPSDVSALARRMKEAGARCPHSRDALLKLNTGRIP